MFRYVIVRHTYVTLRTKIDKQVKVVQIDVNIQLLFIEYKLSLEHE